MSSVLLRSDSETTKTARNDLRDGEEPFGSIFSDIAKMLYPPPKTAAQVAALVGCGERNIELCLSGKQNWSGDAIAAIVSEIMRRHHMRNFKVTKRE